MDLSVVLSDSQPFRLSLCVVLADPQENAEPNSNFTHEFRTNYKLQNAMQCVNAVAERGNASVVLPLMSALPVTFAVATL